MQTLAHLLLCHPLQKVACHNILVLFVFCIQFTYGDQLYKVIYLKKKQSVTLTHMATIRWDGICPSTEVQVTRHPEGLVTKMVCNREMV